MTQQSLKKTDAGRQSASSSGKPRQQRLPWKKPVLEDVSAKIMAQPYIRFT